MDVGNKTLAQLSDEGKEKKYVTLEVGAKVSGYTKDYLERLCRLNKVEYRLWNNGLFVIELESLLNETHTILLSYEGLTFVEKSELTDPIPQIVGNILSSALNDVKPATVAAFSGMGKAASERTMSDTTYEVPRFTDANRIGAQKHKEMPFSYVGRAVVSDSEGESEPAQAEVHVPITARNPDATVLPSEEPLPVKIEEHTSPVSGGIKIPPPPPSSFSVTHKELPQVVHLETGASHKPIHIPVSIERDSVSVLPKPIQSEEMKGVDVWDEALLGGKNESVPVLAPLPEPTPAVLPPAPIAPVLPLAPSPYRPIETSIDVASHRDDAPLFPTLITKYPAQESVPLTQGVPPASVPVVEENRRVIVYEPGIPETTDTEAPESSATAVPDTVPLAPLPMQQSVAVPTRPKNLSLVKESEHHLSVTEKHQLTKSVGFNAVIAVLVIGSSLLLYDGSIGAPSVTFFRGNPEASLAGVGAATYPEGESQEGVGGETFIAERVLPFSDEIEVTPGSKSGSILVQPIFRDSSGGSLEYTITRTAPDPATTTGD